MEERTEILQQAQAGGGMSFTATEWRETMEVMRRAGRRLNIAVAILEAVMDELTTAPRDGDGGDSVAMAMELVPEAMGHVQQALVNVELFTEE